MIETGISFGELHSFWDLDLILASAIIPPASPKESYIDIPGANGSIDMTEAHGEVKYSDRTATFTFHMKPTGDLSDAAWEAKKTEISNRLNGLRCNIALDKDPDYYWQGRCKVNEHTSTKKQRKIVVGARLAPYKLKKDVTRISANLTANPVEITLTNARKPVSPTITCTGNTKLVFDGIEYNFSAGTCKILDIQLKEGETTVSASGTGIVTFEYQECDL